jgi:hypothetical protein
VRKQRKIQFIYPKFRRFYQVLAEWSPLFRTTDYEADAHTRTPPYLAFPLLAPLTPRDIEIDFLDALDLSRLDADLYCLHVKTEMAPRAFQLADEVVGPELSGVDIVPIKTVTGECFSASGPLQCIAAVEYLAHLAPDGRGTTPPAALVSSMGYDGTYAAMVFSGSYV